MDDDDRVRARSAKVFLKQRDVREIRERIKRPDAAEEGWGEEGINCMPLRLSSARRDNPGIRRRGLIVGSSDRRIVE